MLKTHQNEKQIGHHPKYNFFMCLCQKIITTLNSCSFVVLAPYNKPVSAHLHSLDKRKVRYLAQS